MSRYYSMRLRIEEFDSNRTTAIKDAASYEWHFDDNHWEEPANLGNYLECEADDCLCGGETEEEFVDRLSVAIWKANQGFCTVGVIAIYLEEFEDHARDEKDYARLMRSNSGKDEQENTD